MIDRLRTPYLWKSIAIATLFLLFLLALESIWYGVSIPAYFQDHYTYYLRRTGSIWHSTRVLVVVLGGLFLLITYFTLALLSTPKIRIGYFLVFAFAIGVQYGYLEAIGRFWQRSDLGALLVGGADEAASAIELFFTLKPILPILVFLVLLVVFRSRQRFGSFAFLLMIVLLFGYNSVLYQFSGGYFPTAAMQVSLRTVTYYSWDAYYASRFERQLLDFEATTTPTNNVVLIIDESIRRDHLTIYGYERPTTPYLDTLTELGLLSAWEDSIGSATISINSNGVMVNGLSQLPDTTYQSRTNPTLLHYAKAMGYTTHYFDAEQAKLWNGILEEDLPYLDNWVNLNQINADLNRDLEIADRVSAILRSSTGNFVLINKRGIHFPFWKSFPEDAVIWEPLSTFPEFEPENIPRLHNSYNNGLRYNVNGFFERLLGDMTILEDTSIIYTADHAVTLGYDGLQYHQGGTSKFEVMVPIVLFHNGQVEVDTEFAASHYNIFATLLDLMNVPAEERVRDYPLSLLEATSADSQPRTFFAGNSSTTERRVSGVILYDD